MGLFELVSAAIQELDGEHQEKNHKTQDPREISEKSEISPRHLSSGELDNNAPAPFEAELPHPPTWRAIIADWPIDRRQRWADQAEAFQCQGYDWKRAEFAAWRLVETSEDPPVDAPPEPGPPSSPPQSTPVPSRGKLRDGVFEFLSPGGPDDERSR